MSALARYFKAIGKNVSGYDKTETELTKELNQLGINIHFEDKIDLIPADYYVENTLVIITPAVPKHHSEWNYFLERNYEVKKRAEVLGIITKDTFCFAVAGTHGKTTTTSLIASILAEAGMDPTYVIGGKLESANANAKLGTGEYIVAEADESDASFLHLTPVMAVVTNIDADHMDTYEHSFDKLKTAFVDFVQQLPFWGMAVVCVDDANIREILPRITKPVMTYGFSDAARVRAINVVADNGQMRFTVQRINGVTTEFDVTLNLPGKHYVLNALAAIAIASELNVPDAAMIKALKEFKGVGRRFERYGEVMAPAGGAFTLIDDYGHHPVEMAATLAAARGAFPDRRLVLAFQPHRFTRTRDCFGEFVQVLRNFDALVLTEVYPAGEAKIPGADGKSLMKAALAEEKHTKGSLNSAAVVFAANITEMPEKLSQVLKDGDVLITMGAGSISALPHTLAEAKSV